MKQSNPVAQKRFYSVREAAVYTGLSASLLYQELKKRNIQSYRIRTKIVMDRQDLDAFIIANAVRSSDQIREILKEKMSGKRKKAGN